MIAPKTPLPWGINEKIYIDTETGRAVGRIYGAENAAYAIHAANVLPEVVAALREAVDCAVGYMRDRYVDGEGSEDVTRWRAALSKADAAPAATEEPAR